MNATIKAKILKGEALTDAEKAEVQAFDPQASADAAAAAARRQAEAQQKAVSDAHAATVQELNSMKAKLKELEDAGKPEKERIASQLETLKAQVAAAEADKVKLSGDLSKFRRDTRIAEAAADIQFAPGTSAKVKNFILQDAFSTLTDDQLSDAAMVKATKDRIMTDHKPMLLDTAAGGRGGGTADGAGGAAGGAGGGTTGKVWTRAEVAALDARNVTEAQFAEITAQEKAGTLL